MCLSEYDDLNGTQSRFYVSSRTVTGNPFKNKEPPMKASPRVKLSVLYTKTVSSGQTYKYDCKLTVFQKGSGV